MYNGETIARWNIDTDSWLNIENGCIMMEESSVREIVAVSGRNPSDFYKSDEYLPSTEDEHIFNNGVLGGIAGGGATAIVKGLGRRAVSQAAIEFDLQLFAQQDRGMIDKVAKNLGMNNTQRREFGKYVEEYKRAEGIPNNATLSWNTLKELGQEFLGGGN